MKHLRRFLWFFAKRMLVIVLVTSLLIVGFYMAMNSSDMYILLSDGLSARTELILTGSTDAILTNYFNETALSTDSGYVNAIYGLSPYAKYEIKDWNHAVALQWMWSWPWSEYAQVEYTENVTDITGSVRASAASEVKNGRLSAQPPLWEGGRYRVQFRRTDGQWLIDQIVRLEG